MSSYRLLSSVILLSPGRVFVCLFVLKSGLFRYNLHIVKFSLFGFTDQWVLINIYCIVVQPPLHLRHTFPSFQKVPLGLFEVNILLSLIDFCSYQFAFSSMSYRWNHIVNSLLSLDFFLLSTILRGALTFCVMGHLGSLAEPLAFLLGIMFTNA